MRLTNTSVFSEAADWPVVSTEREREIIPLLGSNRPNSFSPADCAGDKSVLKSAGNRRVFV